jgi:hypothetical protein
MTRLRLTIFLTLPLLAAAARAGPADDGLSADIGADELRAHVTRLASDELEGRRAGKPGGSKAAEYIAARFEAAGLEPIGDGYLQPVPLYPELIEEKSSLTAHLPGGKTRAFAPGGDWLVFPTANATRLEGREVVFAGYGIRGGGWNDYAGLDVKGKVVLILRHGPKEDAKLRRWWSFVSKLATARNAGAAGIILVNDRLHHEKEPDRPEAPAFGMPRVNVPFLFAKAEVAEALLAAAGEDFRALQAELDETGKPRSFPLPGVSIDLAFETRRAESPNVVGFLPGRDPKLREEAVVIGGHYDHLGTDGFGALEPAAPGRIFHGADDNASGTAGVIELAEHFAMTKPRPRRSLLFIAFTAEELGLVGSRHYVDHPLLPLEKTVAMLNFDMIGRSRKGFLFIGGTGTSPVFDEVITRAAEGSKLSIRRGEGGAAPSDNTSFFTKGVPSLFFFTGLHPEYHRSTDTADRIDYATEKTILDVAARIAREIGDLEARPAFVRNNTPDFSGGSGPRLGVQVARGGEGEGATIAAVVPGSPAAKAGLAAGDRITGLGGTDIKDLGSLVDAIRSHEIGDEVEVRYVRGGKTATAKVKF